MELRKNQGKWNVIGIDEHDLYRLLSALSHYNASHQKVGRAEVFVDLDIEDVKILPETYNIDNMITLRTLNITKAVDPIDG